MENYFKILSENDNSSEIEISPNVKELSGIIKIDGKTNVKELYGQHLEEKYLK